MSISWKLDSDTFKISNVTEKRNLEAQALHNARLASIGVLAAGVAHDLNNLLTPAMMMTPTLKKEPLSEKASQALLNIEHCIEQAQELGEQIVSFAKGSQDEKNLQRFDVKDVIQKIQAIIASTFPTNIDITHVVEERLSFSLCCLWAPLTRPTRTTPLARCVEQAMSVSERERETVCE